MTENEVKLQEALQQNEVLTKQLQAKMDESERLGYKYAKSQSAFLQIMRELVRFGPDFHENLSVRSRLVQTKVAARDL